MAIHGFDSTRVADTLAKFASPGEPVRTIERLKGRDEALLTIERALASPGKNIFIYGERGVGKSSLAATAAFQYQSSDAQPIFVTGSRTATFNSIIANIANRALSRPLAYDSKSKTEVSLAWRGLSWKHGVEVSDADIVAHLRTTGDAVALLEEVARVHSRKPIVVIDEFDMIESEEERNEFASLLKALSDQGSQLKFIFTGVGKSLESLLGAHHSVWRQLATIDVLRLGWDGRREVANQIAAAFGLPLDDDVCWRIAIVCDGFPHYIHHIVEKMIWAAFDQESEAVTLDHEHYQSGLRDAIKETNAELKGAYEKAVQARPVEMEYIVWASADTDEDYRVLNSMYDSYCVISESHMATPYPASKFSDLLRKLKQVAYGQILQQVDGRPGWYTYREKVLRGYVRMCAESYGIELTGYRPGREQRRQIPETRAYKGPSTPKGVRLKGDN